eukprot:TRINITY_DN2785_c0_g2_i2.p1 TRINITY_DN2785_c0_g2~~TRINITY_DN2785_c0_g2_i2.p1  ORF type:complete len:224 (-),score=56.37 TRINITY_DN2785_c0_g2_i2:286-957(-)
MIVEDVDTFVKIITVGNGAVGKTSLIRRFCEGVFTGQYQKTLAVDFVEKRDFEVKGVPEPVTLNVWDTAGQEEYNAITSTYYRGAHGCILCFASDDSKSLDDLDKWNSKVHEQCPGIPMLIVQTKVDLLSDRSKETISQEQAEAKAAALNMKLYRTSVKDDTNVQEVFSSLVQMFHKHRLAKEEVERMANPESKLESKTETVAGSDLQAPDKKRAAQKKDGCC